MINLNSTYQHQPLIDPHRCMARKNKTTGIMTQCPCHPKYHGFCGKHANADGKLDGVLRIDEDLDVKTISKIAKMQEKMTSEKNTKILEINELNRLSKYPMIVLKNSLKNFGLKSSGNKKQMIQTLQTYYQSLNNYLPYEDKIKTLQKNIRLYLQTKNIKLRGPALYDRKLCNNTEDFYTFELIEELPNQRFFSYRDIDGFIYGFEIKSFFKLLENNMENPYNRKNIPTHAVVNFSNLLEQEKTKELLQEKENETLTEQQKFNDKVLKIFQQIENLTSSVNIEWFMCLDSNLLKKFYKALEDIWNYRAELNQTQKYNIVQDLEMFPVTVYNYYKIKSTQKLRLVLLDEIEKLIFTAADDADKTLACYYVLTALCEVSEETRQIFPWLYQE